MSRTIEFRRNTQKRVREQMVLRRRRQNIALKKKGRRLEMDQHPIYRAAPSRRPKPRYERNAAEAIEASMQFSEDFKTQKAPPHLDQLAAILVGQMVFVLEALGAVITNSTQEEIPNFSLIQEALVELIYLQCLLDWLSDIPEELSFA